MTIRPLAASAEHRNEIELVSALAVSAYGGDYELSAEYLAEIGDVSGRVRAAEVWVAEIAGEIVGTVTVPRPGERLQDDTQPDEMDVRLLAVSGRARGAGVGEALMRHCMVLAGERGARRLVLHTGSMMLGARRLYERMGFERIPEREFEFETLGETREILAYGISIEPSDQRLTA